MELINQKQKNLANVDIIDGKQLATWIMLCVLITSVVNVDISEELEDGRNNNETMLYLWY